MRDPDTAADTHDSPRYATHRRTNRNWSRRQALASLASVGTLALAGCSLQSVMPGVQPLWERDFSAATAAGPPAATDEHVVVGGQDKRLHAFTADGERAFHFETGGPIEARPAVPASGGPVHVHSTDGDLYTVGLSGTERWHEEGRARDGWLGRQGSLLVDVDPREDVITGYDARDGTRRFQRSGQRYPYPTLSESACIVAVPDGNGDTELIALSPTTGERLWESQARDGYPRVVATGDRIVTVRNSTIRMRRARDGNVQWETAVAGEVTSYFGPPLWLGEHVYVRAGRDNRVDEFIGINRDTGSIQWRRNVGYELERVTATPEGVFVASSVDDPGGGLLVRLDAFALDGTRRWKTTTDIAIGGTVEALDSVGDVLVVASDHELAAYDPDSGSRRWQYGPESNRISVAATDGALYVSYRDTGGLARLPTS